jgi:hypothetical protein
MYRMSESEFMQFEQAEKRLRELQKNNEIELQQAYDGIHPTRVRFDYSLGTIYSESVNPADYAIYLIELREEHERQEKWWGIRAEAYREALQMLTDEDRSDLKLFGYGNYSKRKNARKRLSEALTIVINTRTELQRRQISFEEVEDLEEVDRQIDKMSMKELLEDYWDKDEEPFKKPSKSTLTVKVMGPNEKHSVVSAVKISYLPSNELEAYRSGKRGGCRWFSYDDYLKMKKSGMSNKEISLAMGIETDQLYKRLKAWRYKIIQLESDAKIVEKSKRTIAF